MGQQASAGSARRRWSPSGAERLARPGAAARLWEGEEAQEEEPAYSWQQEGRCSSAAPPGSRRGSPGARLPGSPGQRPGSSADVPAGARPPRQLQHELPGDGGELEPLHEQQRPRSGQQRGSPGDKLGRHSPARPAFEGDLSEWGKPDLEELYDESASEAGSGTTLSSGLGPGGGRAPRRPNARPFDLEAAEAALSYGAGQYGRAQALRREGAAPAALGLADDLPTRMAYEQLNILAGMAGKVRLAAACGGVPGAAGASVPQCLCLALLRWTGAAGAGVLEHLQLSTLPCRLPPGLLQAAGQGLLPAGGPAAAMQRQPLAPPAPPRPAPSHSSQVQDAILHNRRIFEQRLVAEQRSLLKRAWHAWRDKCGRSAAKAAVLRRALARITRGTLARAFCTWRDELHLVDKTLAMRRKVGGRVARWWDLAACVPGGPAGGAGAGP